MEDGFVIVNSVQTASSRTGRGHSQNAHTEAHAECLALLSCCAVIITVMELVQMGDMQHNQLCDEHHSLVQVLVAAAAAAVVGAAWQPRGIRLPGAQHRSSSRWRHRSSSTGRRRRRSSPTRSAPGTRSRPEAHWPSPA